MFIVFLKHVSGSKKDSFLKLAKLRLQVSFLKGSKPALPDFNRADVDTWLDICRKKFDDFCIDDPTVKYQMLSSALDTRDAIKMAPYMSVGEKD